MSDKYCDILYMAYPLPGNRQRMSMVDRAAQFSPFASLVGFEDTIEESARLTNHRIELDENEKYMLDLYQQQLTQIIDQKPPVTITYFLPDTRKEGGQYITVTGQLRSISPHYRTLTLADGMVIPLYDVIKLESPMFSE